MVMSPPRLRLGLPRQRAAECARIAVQVLGLALVLYVCAAGPGLLDDAASTVPAASAAR